MHHTRSGSLPTDTGENRAARDRSWLAAAGLFGAVLASSCCIVPLILVALGVSGAWISNLVALEPYRPLFLAATFTLLVLGFLRVYGREANKECAEGAYCARPESAVITKSVLWLAAGVAVAALSVNWWAPLLY